MKTAIVTTLIHAGSVLDFFIDYHLSLGFDHLFLFFDDPDDPTIPIAERYTNVTIVRNDQYLHQRWEQTHLLRMNRAYAGYIHSETMARQLLNVEVAIQMAVDKEITWLLHIDIDELFYCPNESVRTHFEKITALGRTHITYANHEAVVEQVSVDNYFTDVTLFKKNIATLSRSQIEFLHRQEAFEYGNKYFLYYSIGKSAAKVCSDLLPVTVHSYQESSSDLCSNPVILHYPVCGLDHFLKKYQILGAFEDYWFGKVSILHHMPFHLHSRDVIKKKDLSSALDFYKTRIMMTNQNWISACVEAGLFFRTDIRSSLLAKTN